VIQWHTALVSIKFFIGRKEDTNNSAERNNILLNICLALRVFILPIHLSDFELHLSVLASIVLRSILV